MYCPNCGKENPEGIRFCRSCGLSLQAVAPTFSDELAATRTDDSPVPRVSRMQAAWQNPFIYALLLIVLGIMIGAVGNKALSSQVASDIGTIIALLGVGLLGLKGVMLVVAPPSSVPPTSPRTKAKDASRINRAQLSAEPPGVTENTTRQLDASLEVSKEKSRDTQPT